MLRIVNRVLLALTGILLLVPGVVLLGGGLDLPRRWDVPLPSGFPWSGPSDVVLTSADRTKWQDEGWWWPVVIAALAVLVVLLLWWLLSQLRRHRLTEMLVDSGDGEGALVRGRAVEDVLAAEAESFPGVDGARVRLTGRRTRPRARVALTLAADAMPGQAVRRLREEALEHARISAGLKELPAELRMRSARHRAERVS